jgi:hypothetical protein
VLSAAANALRSVPRDDTEQTRLSRLAGIEPVGEAEAAEIAARITVRSFAMRKDLLRDTISSARAAEILGVSAQTVRNRMQRGKILAVRERGDYRFPIWQFDTGGEDGVIRGLPRALNELELPPISKLRWLTHPNPSLDDRTPLDVLRQGDIETVIAEARAIGAT